MAPSIFPRLTNTMTRSTVVIFIWLLQFSLGAKYEGCESPQYLEYGKSGVIDCFFHENFTSIFWYDSTNIAVDKPIVTLINSVKGGQGYISGKFDISSNGSLIITDVGVGHGKNFTVAKFVSLDLDGDPMIFVVTAVVKGVISDECDSPQYLEYGRNGTVQCLFQTNFLSLLWYNSTDTVVDAPIVAYTRAVKRGRGFESGEFDIFSNGSLVIHEVGMVHEQNYTAAKFTDLNEEPIVFVVRVIVTVKSLLEGPVVDKCESNGPICFTELDGSSAVSCIVRGVRPAVSLKWLTLTSSGDHKISSKISSFRNNVTFTSRTVTLDAFAYSPVLSLLVCKAEFAPGVLQRDKSFVLVQNSQRNLSSIPPVIKYAPRGSTLELDCTGNIIPYLQVVWKRSLPFDNQYQNLMFAVFMKNHFETKYNDHFQFGENGSLILPQVDSQHDGFYGCIYGDGITDGMTKYEVVTYVNPVPSYPVVEGCKYKSHCVLEVNRKGKLTCFVTGIRPEVILMWKVSNKTSSGKITFFEHTTTVTESGGTFNITLTSSYSIISVTRVTVKCGASGPGSVIFPSHSIVDLLAVPAEEPDDSSVPTRNHNARIVMFVLPVVVGLLCGMKLIISARYRCRKRKSRKEASLEDCELGVPLPVPHSDKGNQSSSGKFARNEETPDFKSLFLLLSRHLGADWKDVARRLLLEESHVCKIEADCCGSENVASFNMLMLWKMTKGSHATSNTLIEAFKEVGREDLADIMQSRKEHEEDPLLEDTSEGEKLTKLQEDLDNMYDKILQSRHEEKRTSEEWKKKVKELEENLYKLQEIAAHIQEIQRQLAGKDKEVAKFQADLNKKDKEIQLVESQVEKRQKEPKNFSSRAMPRVSSSRSQKRKPDEEMYGTFLYLQKHISKEWQDVGKSLGLNSATLDRIHRDNKDQISETIFRVLCHWKQKNGTKATYAYLIRALEEAERKDLADDVKNRKDAQWDEDFSINSSSSSD